MPRKAPKEVIEHRITLGDYERKELKQAIDSYQQDKVLENVPNIMLGAAGVVAAGAAGLVGYALYYWLDSVPSITDVWQSFKDRFKETVTKGPDALRGAAENIAYSYLRDISYEELDATLSAKVAQIDAEHAYQQQIANDSNANFFLKKNAIAAMSTYQLRRQALLDKNAAIIARWFEIQEIENAKTNNQES